MDQLPRHGFGEAGRAAPGKGLSIVFWNDANRQLSLRLAKGSRMMAPENRKLVVKVAGQTLARDVVFAGRPVAVKL